MSLEGQYFLTTFAFFVLGAMLGYAVRLQKHMDEVAEWKAIARKAQHLNVIARTLKQERGEHGER